MLIVRKPDVKILAIDTDDFALAVSEAIRDMLHDIADPKTGALRRSILPRPRPRCVRHRL